MPIRFAGIFPVILQQVMSYSITKYHKYFCFPLGCRENQMDSSNGGIFLDSSVDLEMDIFPTSEILMLETFHIHALPRPSCI